ncbi:thioredoxin-like protein [Basidiobolus meristosporus CBS 931.73]|uniref:Thioredoxin-like protein n=1 Tax=Basidiobolus meristosporus CBS 931.73 TaxID=1314790 RepID=A0A1Y1XST7_9FUNG|nr:thioredoxin-like protein [Basidiobolus meristosporus CBS 931.73]|eukprot:ORX88827.1 thioredoxin-like protein [Basidiobolus meristosporus CBS 931.73]
MADETYINEKIENLASRTIDNESEDEDALFAELENDDAFESYREERLEQLQRELNQVRDLKEKDHGAYTEIDSEKEILKITTTTPQCVVHFFHKDFRRCQIMDTHLEKIASRHFRTKFCKIDVENAGFLVEKLKIKVLPCVMSFVNGISVDKLVGFEELGNTDGFKTDLVEARLVKCGVIKKPESNSSKQTSIFGFPEKQDDDDWDSDE